MVMKFKYKEDQTLESRKAEAQKIRAKYQDRIPVIVEKVPRSQIADIDKKKFLVPSEISVAQFQWIIRKRITLAPERAIFLFVKNTIPQQGATMGQIYDEFKDDDGFLYVSYSGENVFG